MILMDGGAATESAPELSEIGTRTTAMSFELFWEPRGVVLRFAGVVLPSDPREATVAYEGDVRFGDLRFVIADYSAIAGCAARPSDMEMVGATNFGASKSNPRIRKAVVTTSPEVIAMAEHYRKVLRSPVPTQVFATMADARAWLSRA